MKLYGWISISHCSTNTHCLGSNCLYLRCIVMSWSYNRELLKKVHYCSTYNWDIWLKAIQAFVKKITAVFMVFRRVNSGHHCYGQSSSLGSSFKDFSKSAFILLHGTAALRTRIAGYRPTRLALLETVRQNFIYEMGGSPYSPCSYGKFGLT